jgi:hypothetical protein
MIARCSACLLICAVLAGCSVTPAAFSDHELLEQAVDQASRLAANEEPVTGPIPA